MGNDNTQSNRRLLLLSNQTLFSIHMLVQLNPLNERANQVNLMIYVINLFEVGGSD